MIKLKRQKGDNLKVSGAVCVCEREREREREQVLTPLRKFPQGIKKKNSFIHSLQHCLSQYIFKSFVWSSLK